MLSGYTRVYLLYLLATDDVINTLVRHLSGVYDLIELIRASSVLACFTSASREVTEIVFEQVDLNILGLSLCVNSVNMLVVLFLAFALSAMFVLRLCATAFTACVYL